MIDNIGLKNQVFSKPVIYHDIICIERSCLYDFVQCPFVPCPSAFKFLCNFYPIGLDVNSRVAYRIESDSISVVLLIVNPNSMGGGGLSR